MVEGRRSFVSKGLVISSVFCGMLLWMFKWEWAMGGSLRDLFFVCFCFVEGGRREVRSIKKNVRSTYPFERMLFGFRFFII